METDDSLFSIGIAKTNTFYDLSFYYYLNVYIIIGCEESLLEFFQRNDLRKHFSDHKGIKIIFDISTTIAKRFEVMTLQNKLTRKSCDSVKVGPSEPDPKAARRAVKCVQFLQMQY